MKKINLAFAGFRHGHIYALYESAKTNENLAIAGAWEEYAPSVKEAEEEHGVVFNYKSYEDILNDKEVDAVAIGNYYGARGKMVIEALEAGKHIISDKPLCISLDEIHEIKRIAEKKKLETAMMLDLRYNANAVTAKRLIEKGEIGRVNNIYFGGQHPLLYGLRAGWYFEDGKHGGVINDIAVHGIDLMKYMANLETDEVLAARCWNAFAAKEPKFLDSAQFMLRMKGGAGLIADVSYAVPDSIGFDLPCYWNFKIWGTEGVMEFSAGSSGVTVWKSGKTKAAVYEGETAASNVLEDFVKRVNGDKNVILPSTADTLSAAEATLKIQHCADEIS